MFGAILTILPAARSAHLSLLSSDKRQSLWKDHTIFLRNIIALKIGLLTTNNIEHPQIA